MEIIVFHPGLNSCSNMDREMVLYETRLARNMWQHVTLKQSDIHSNHTRSLNREACPNENLLLYVTAGLSEVLKNNPGYQN
ncbi:hypothetical protein OUZ56_033040 [Daphnia magna]|uniref:Uncharacterized protein n=1 Tax=Daphnia magna TaxID=35525 RepID=A0ABR0BA28_9CRUS|nr:hypothetical protein OUZ56_033040 [Daphnia magna]